MILTVRSIAIAIRDSISHLGENGVTSDDIWMKEGFQKTLGACSIAFSDELSHLDRSLLHRQVRQHRGLAI